MIIISKQYTYFLKFSMTSYFLMTCEFGLAIARMLPVILHTTSAMILINFLFVHRKYATIRHFFARSSIWSKSWFQYELFVSLLSHLDSNVIFVMQAIICLINFVVLGKMSQKFSFFQAAVPHNMTKLAQITGPFRC